MGEELQTSQVLSFEDARRVVEEHGAKLHPAGAEESDLLSSIGRVLAEPVHADRDFPPFNRAARDGYAVRSADLASIPQKLNVIGEIKAGAAEVPGPVTSGQAVAIMTGAPAPAGTDAVVMVEYTSSNGSQVEITRSIKAGDNIVPTGSEARQGNLLLAPGTRLDEAAISVLASVGKSRVRVYARPRVAILSTGDEVVSIETEPAPYQIRNSNTYSLAAQIKRSGGEPVLLPIAPDEITRLRELIEAGLQSDFLLLAGGVSMGKYDLVEQVLAELGAEFFFTGAAIQPGRPVVFGRVHGKYFFGLPGNPVSTMVTFELFARAILEALMGMRPRAVAFLRARLKSDVKTKTGLTRFLPAILSGQFDEAEVELAGWHGSGDIATTARANCYLVIAPDRERFAAGEWVPVLMRSV
ncbi:MAG TPA: gephyrin-like molybdotransferase Glp [Terriglobales bacterium]|nr:gephyrin-like molybdotransferase Glp [Terriglobales bacterium]